MYVFVCVCVSGKSQWRFQSHLFNFKLSALKYNLFYLNLAHYHIIRSEYFYKTWAGQRQVGFMYVWPSQDLISINLFISKWPMCTLRVCKCGCLMCGCLMCVCVCLSGSVCVWVCGCLCVTLCLWVGVNVHPPFETNPWSHVVCVCVIYWVPPLQSHGLLTPQFFIIITQHEPGWNFNILSQVLQIWHRHMSLYA